MMTATPPVPYTEVSIVHTELLSVPTEVPSPIPPTDASSAAICRIASWLMNPPTNKMVP